MSAEGAPATRKRRMYRGSCDGHNRLIFRGWEGPGSQNPLQICSESVQRPSAESKEARRQFFPSLRGPLAAAGPKKSSRGDFRNLNSGQVEKSDEAQALIAPYLQWIVTLPSEANDGPKYTQQPPKK